MEWKAISYNLLVSCFLFVSFGSCEATYKVGVGRADCTGPSAEIGFMGYAKLGQRGCGIHLRQFSRAFIFDDGKNIASFVSIDACMMNHGVKKSVLEELEKRFDKGYFTESNLILSGTHTHSGPGGFLMDVILDFTNMGFAKETFDALVNGIVRSIQNAHKNMVEAKVYLNSGILLNSNINRSPAAYLYNPDEERSKYEHDTDVEMVQLKIVEASNNELIGSIQWYPVHPTSMNNTNCLVSSDNVGYASILLETAMDNTNLPGKSKFVGAFASTNLGDVSPNLRGPRCLNTDEPCETVTSTCNGQARQCVARGPGRDHFESTKIIGTNLFNKAKELLTDNKEQEVTGDLRYIHQFVHMPSQKVPVTLKNGTETQVKGCLPAMGVGFAAGTIDGVGEFNFHQASNNTNSTNPFWYIVRDFIFPPTPEDVACHTPKPILITSGRIKLPYEWQPEVVALQYIKLGNVILAAVPGEFTTMSGRRLRDTIQNTIEKGGSSNIKVIITGLSNVYTNYIATPEEYQLQRYEGASTIYGPHTLTIYLYLYEKLAENLMSGLKEISGPQPFEFPPKDQLLSLNPDILFDSCGWFNNYGDCIQQPPSTVQIGEEVTVKFISGHPRNDLRQEDTFLTVEKKTDSGWNVIANDASWDTKFIWRRTHEVKGSSEVEIIWNTGDNVEPGTYRIRHFGNYKYIFGGIYPYEGTTKDFIVTKKKSVKENLIFPMK